jgi:tetratricopeptide (TPR) repeat protein
MAAPEPVRKRKKTKRQSRLRKNWWLALVLGGLVLVFWVATGPRWTRARIVLTPPRKPISGYLGSLATLQLEYARYYGGALESNEVKHDFELAGKRVAAKDYTSAAGLLEQVAKTAAVPQVYNNLGVLYVELEDKSRAINAFREALARDINYGPARTNLERMPDLMQLGAEPVTREVEPNNSITLANIIAPGRSTDGEIEAAVNDVDCFRVTTPPAPRDMISIELTNHSETLAPVLKIFDAEHRVLDWGKTVHEPGADLKVTIAPAPNSTLYLQISGYGSSAGAYSLLVKPAKAFDAYEPNDDIFHAHRIALGERIEAGIMDAIDTDYFSFVSPRTGTLNVAIKNRSATLIPALSTFDPDMRSSGFGPDIKTPGSDLPHTMEVLENQTYFIQVWALRNTTGAYTLVVE